MVNEVNLDVENTYASWMWSWLKWIPTSQQLLKEAESKILANLEASYRGHFVNIGKVVGNEDNLIWTLSTNEESTNTPLVLIHGFGSGLGLWCLNIDSFAAQRPVYAFDITGFGRSSRPKFNKDALEAEGDFIKSIESWRKSLNLDKFILLGHSFGGFLAASYAIKYPDMVDHLVLVDPWGFPERPLNVAERYNLPIWVKAIGALVQPFNPLFLIRTAGPLGPKIIEKARPDLAKKFSPVVKNANEILPNYLYHCNAQNPTGEAAFHSVMSGFGWAKYPMIHRIDSLRKEVPISLIYGARSWVDRDPGFQIKYMRPDSYVDVQIIQGAGHHVYADRSSLFNDIVNSIGSYVDKGQLPPLAKTTINEVNPNPQDNEFNKFVNVGKENNESDEVNANQ